ncbi:outer membrane beta-barrel family protein [Mucilaginibacter sp. UR6-11]|uniref:outer membrane beta-barrel family protein n=1 Tax=Mucilaginibacter sp. UR6-11 TaxID=1435644 RepID=UPI001E3EFBB5|nr:outer membrane beta-barrel family protein [Mucilaginibacter sp. UR6-11]MCC8425692.1 TonB-dependent receptor family protein [Mucilaginibacter sp. UR6-11]
MKRIILLILIICSVISAKAQFGVGGGGPSIVGKISGQVTDSITHKGLDYGTVSLFRSTGKSPITGVLTDDKGNFQLDNIHPGVYRLEVTFVGYPTKVISNVETTPGKPDKNLGVLVVSPSAKALKEVTITGTAALVENRIDKIVYNAEKDLTSQGGSATDILQKVPLVSVDINGNVSLRGDGNVRVLINGRPSGATSASLADVLKGIPADQIKSIEVITSPSAKYDAEGSAGIINIITKQKNISGISGSISGGVGTRQNNGNMNLNYNKNRFNLTINAGGNASWPQLSNTYFSQKIDRDTVHTFTETKGTTRVSRHAVIGSVSAGYEFNAFNSLNTSIRLNQIEFNTTTNSQTAAAKSYSLNSVGHAVPASGFDWNIDYVHKFKKEGEELDLSTQWSHSIGTTEFTNTYSAVFKNLKNNIDGTNNEYTVQADYTLPINKVFKLESGGKYIIRRINTNNDLYSPVGNDFVFNDLTSSTYGYNQNVTAAYSVFTITLPKGYSVLAGLRDEYTTITGNPHSLVQAVTPFTQDYNTLIPSLTFQKKISTTQTIKLGYSKRITRPSLQFLNPYIDSTNVQSLKVGNPRLNPEISQTIELGYNTYIGSSIINLSAYYKHTSGLIEGIATPISVVVNGVAQGGTITTYQNIGNNNSLGGSFFGSITPFKALTIMGNINAYTYKPDPSGVFNLAQSQNGTYMQYQGFLRATLTLPKDIVAESFAFGSSSRRTIQGSNPSFSIFGVGVKKQFDNKKYALGLNAIQPFSTYKNFDSNISSPGFTQTSKFQLPFRSFGLTFSYNFGKMSFSNPNPMEKKKGVNNDDLKQGDGGVGGGGAGGVSGGGGR